MKRKADFLVCFIFLASVLCPSNLSLASGTCCTCPTGGSYNSSLNLCIAPLQYTSCSATISSCISLQNADYTYSWYCDNWSMGQHKYSVSPNSTFVYTGTQYGDPSWQITFDNSCAITAQVVNNPWGPLEWDTVSCLLNDWQSWPGSQCDYPSAAWSPIAPGVTACGGTTWDCGQLLPDPTGSYAMIFVNNTSTSTSGCPAGYSPYSSSSCYANPTSCTSAYTVTSSAGANGSVSPSSATDCSGGSFTLTITPSAGYHLSKLTDNGTNVTTSAYWNGSSYMYTISHITGNDSVQATFAPGSPPPPAAPVPALSIPVSVLLMFGLSAILWLARKKRKTP